MHDGRNTTIQMNFYVLKYQFEECLCFNDFHCFLCFCIFMSPPTFSPEEVCNINVGVMGHVDSGKTSLGMLFRVIII